jgi:hypothetical protein
MISHGFSGLHIGVPRLRAASAIGTLVETMIVPAGRALGVATTGRAPLLAAGQLSAATTAVLLSAIAGAANKENCATLQASAKTLSQRIVFI